MSLLVDSGHYLPPVPVPYAGWKLLGFAALLAAVIPLTLRLLRPWLVQE